jgi:hypothetical protein
MYFCCVFGFIWQNRALGTEGRCTKFKPASARHESGKKKDSSLAACCRYCRRAPLLTPVVAAEAGPPRIQFVSKSSSLLCQKQKEFS